MSHYAHHVFFCLNKRDNGEACCADYDSESLQAYAKQKCKTLDLNGPGKVRINKAGCLDRCEFGPVCVVYPQGTWYTAVDKDDIDEIIEQHLINGKVVERLEIK